MAQTYMTPLEAFGVLDKPIQAITIDDARSIIADKCVVREAAGLPRVAGEWRGPEGFLGLMRAMIDTFPNFSFKLEKFVTNDVDLIALKGRVSGDTPGGRFDIPLVEFWTFENGKAVDILPMWHDTKLVSDLYHTTAGNAAA